MLDDPTHQRIIMRFPTAGGAVPHAAGGMYALHYPATALSPEAVPAAPPVQLFVHGNGWREAAKQYGTCVLNFANVIFLSKTTILC